MVRDPYSILGVPIEATQSEITAAYRRLALENHPDVSKSGGTIARMQDINAAYKLLRSPAARAAHDRKHPVGGAAGRQTAGHRAGDRGTRSGTADLAGAFPSYRILGGNVDRAIVGVLASVVILILALLFAGDSVYWGASIALAVGCWVASVPNVRLSSQHGAAVGAVIGIFLAAMIGSSSFGETASAGLAGQIACCAPFTIAFGASTGAMLATAAGWIRRAASFRVQSDRKEPL